MRSNITNPFQIRQPKKPDIRVNDIISRAAYWHRPAVVQKIFEYGDRTYADVHFLDVNTGKLLKCPDKQRCQHGSGCPIHGRAVRTSDEDLSVWTKHDIDFYEKEKMLSPEIAEAARKARR